MSTPPLILLGSSLSLAAPARSLPGVPPPGANGPPSPRANALAGACAANEYVFSGGERHPVCCP